MHSLAPSALLPPPELSSFGGGNFTEIGKEFFRYFVTIGGLRAEDDVLEVGSGNGRMAAPLTSYLTRGSYEGFDVAKTPVGWCTDAITPHFPRFRFQWVDVKNGLYNPTGSLDAASFVFPYPSDSFNFVFLTSVFTHLLEREIHQYLGEICRVLRPRGRMFATFFLANAVTEQCLLAGKSSLSFQHSLGACRTMNPRTPEDALLYPEERVRSLCMHQGLQGHPLIRYGTWSGRSDGLSFQDILVLEKTGLHS